MEQLSSKTFLLWGMYLFSLPDLDLSWMFAAVVANIGTSFVGYEYGPGPMETSLAQVTMGAEWRMTKAFECLKLWMSQTHPWYALWKQLMTF